MHDCLGARLHDRTNRYVGTYFPMTREIEFPLDNPTDETTLSKHNAPDLHAQAVGCVATDSAQAGISMLYSGIMALTTTSSFLRFAFVTDVI